MTLEDFFTPTEMKDGLSSLGRVEELVSFMQKQGDCVLNNVGDAVRQWSPILDTLVATVNRGFLNHFVQLNGLCFLNRWLQEALKYNGDDGDSALEMLITTLERLPVDEDKLSVSGIDVTVGHLFGHRSPNIKQKAELLSSKWNNARVHDVSCDNLVTGGACLSADDPKPSAAVDRTEDRVHSIHTVSLGKEGVAEAGFSVESSGTECQKSDITRCTDSLRLESTEDIKNSLSNHLLTNSTGADAILGNSLGSSHVSNYACGGNNVDNQQDALVFDEVFDGAGGIKVEVNTKVYESSQQENSAVSSSGLSDTESIDEASVEPTRHCNFAFEGGESSDLKSKEAQVENSDMKETYREDSTVRRDEDVSVSTDSSKGVSTDSSKGTGPIAIGQMDRKSGLGLEDEEIDALEVARQVAIEVEREVVDYREPCCSSPEVNSGETLGTCCPEGKQDQSIIEELDGKSPTRKDLSDDAVSPKEHHSIILENVATDAGEPELTSESAKVTTTAQVSIGKSETNRCVFDLNEDFYDEEFDCSMDPIPNIAVNISVPIHVTGSKATLRVPVTPLHFEGEMGWKGSAATSAFRTASPRKTSDGERTSCPKPKPNILNFDLNVTENENDVACEAPASAKQILPTCGLPSGDSSVEVSSKTAERLNLDLNRLGDEETPPNPSSYWRLYHHNGDQNLSSASSSSLRQHSIRDFDLNDNLCLLDAGGPKNLDKSSSRVSTKYRSSVTDEPAMTIMGSRMAVGRRDSINQSHPSFVGGGLNMETMMAARPVSPYVHMPPHYYGYAGPPMDPSMFIPPGIYGPHSVSYMMDPKGNTIMPQLIGSAGPNGSTSVRPPFLVSVAGPTPGFIGAGPSRAGMDLNSSMISLDVGAREVGGLRQPFLLNGLAEQTRTNASQPSSSGLPMKRKEPENGWEPYPLGYKQMTWQ